MQLEQIDSRLFAPAVAAVEQLLTQQENTKQTLFVGIDGRCGAGKTTLGNYLKKKFDCNLFHMDDFFLQMQQRTPERLAEIGGNADYERFFESVLKPALLGKEILYEPFSCREGRLLECVTIPYQRLNIIEGSYSLHPYFKNPYHVKIFMDISLKKQMETILLRNGAQQAVVFREKWIPKEEAYFEKFNIKKDTIVIFRG